MKILVVFTGGTIGSSVNGDGYFSPDRKKSYRLLELYKKYCSSTNNKLPKWDGEELSFDTVEPYTILSENLDMIYAQKLVHCISQNLKKDYDGIIVTHGSDTLQYTAAILGYAFGNDTIPIMLVASNYILDDMRANGVDNFAGAVEFIRQHAGRGVFVSYRNTGEHTHFHRATRLIAHAPYSDYLSSVDNIYYGSFCYGRIDQNQLYKEREDECQCLCTEWNNLRASIAWLNVHPAMAFPKLENGLKAILVSSYHSGTMNTASARWNAYFRTAAEKGIPVFLTGASEGMSYESTRAYEENGIQVLPKMSPIAAYIKLLLGTITEMDYKEYMSKSLGGDLL